MAKKPPQGGFSQWQNPDEFADDAWTSIAAASNAAHAALMKNPDDPVAKAIWSEASITVLRGREARQEAEGRPRSTKASGYTADGELVVLT